MNAYQNTILLLIIFIAVVNGKDILDFIVWLRFKIKIYFKRLENERKDSTRKRP